MQMKTKLTPRFWTALILFSLIGQVAWVVENMYLNVFIYKMFHASAGNISAMVAASAVAATVTTVFVGAWSDRVGRRRIFMSLGYILWGLSVGCFALLRMDLISAVIPATASAAAVGVTLTIILDCVMTFFGSSANDAAYNAWLTDNTDSTNRGAADIIGGVVFLVGIAGFFLVDDYATTPTETGYWENVSYGFRKATVRENRELYRSFLLFILFNISIQIFMPYLILYYEVALGMKNYVLVMAPAIILAAGVTAVWGRVYDSKGFSLAVKIALLWLLLGFVVLFLFRNTALVFIGSLLMMCGYLSGMAVFGARIRDYTPEGKAGMLQGIRIFSQVLIPGVVGPFIGKTVLQHAEVIVNNDGTTSFIPNANIFLAALVPAALVLFWILIRRKTD